MGEPAGERRRVAFVVNSLGYGGAERVLSVLLGQSEARLGAYELHLILLDEEPERRAMPAYVTKHVLGAGGRLGASIAGLRCTLAALRPHAVVSFLIRANVASVIACRLAAIPCVISERMHTSRHLSEKYRGAARLAAQAGPWLTYRFADAIIAVSAGVRDNLVAEYGAPAARTFAIANPYEIERITAEAGARAPIDLPERFIVSVGRLEPSKNFGELIEAYLEADLDEALVILGEGPERGALEALAAARGAQGRVLLPGYLDNPFAVVARARFYACASLCEGFPNAMAEAMALGVPAVATDCLSGPAELLADVVKADPDDVLEAPYGILVAERNRAALSRGLRRMAAPEIQARYAALGRARMEAFGAARIAERYWEVIEAAMARRS